MTARRFPIRPQLGGIIITGSAAGVYDDLPWLEPLRQFIRAAYAGERPRCSASASAIRSWPTRSAATSANPRRAGVLGGTSTRCATGPAFLGTRTGCPGGRVLAPGPGDRRRRRRRLSSSPRTSPRTPGCVYRNGAAISLQPHPEFDDDYTLALAELRRGKAPDAVVDTAVASLATASHSRDVAGYLAAFLRG